MIRFALVFLFFSSGVYAASNEPAFAPDEIDFLKKLEREGHVTHANCAEIASLLLTQIGLPAIGATTPVRGERLNLDRRGERNEPPMFLDEVVRSRKPYSAYRLESRAVGIYWQLIFTRELHPRNQPPLKLETTFVYQPQSRLNHPTCELTTLEFKSVGLKKWAESMDAHDCIALTDLDARSASAWVKDPALFNWVKADCDLGLQSFKSAKDALAEDSKKRAR